MTAAAAAKLAELDHAGVMQTALARRDCDEAARCGGRRTDPPAASQPSPWSGLAGGVIGGALAGWAPGTLLGPRDESRAAPFLVLRVGLRNPQSGMNDENQPAKSMPSCRRPSVTSTGRCSTTPCPCLITLQRERRTYGYSCQRFMHQSGECTDEIAMNLTYFGVRPIPATLHAGA